MAPTTGIPGGTDIIGPAIADKCEADFAFFPFFSPKKSNKNQTENIEQKTNPKNIEEALRPMPPPWYLALRPMPPTLISGVEDGMAKKENSHNDRNGDYRGPCW